MRLYTPWLYHIWPVRILYITLIYIYINIYIYIILLTWCTCLPLYVFRCLFPGYINRKALDKKSFPCNDAQTFIFRWDQAPTTASTVSILDNPCLIPYEQAVERIEGHLTLTRDRDSTAQSPPPSSTINTSNHINKQKKESNSNTNTDDLNNNDIKHSHSHNHKKQRVNV